MTYPLAWRLRRQHRQLERALREAQREPQPDPFVIQDLKRRKLQVKDALFLAEAGLVPAGVRPGHG